VDEIIRFQVRISPELHSKMRVIAALKGISLNGAISEALAEHVRDWETKHGELPKPPAEA
jgi:hypothetical protein